MTICAVVMLINGLYFYKKLKNNTPIVPIAIPVGAQAIEPLPNKSKQ
jgi:hypothetical protein